MLYYRFRCYNSLFKNFWSWSGRLRSNPTKSFRVIAIRMTNFLLTPCPYDSEGQMHEVRTIRMRIFRSLIDSLIRRMSKCCRYRPPINHCSSGPLTLHLSRTSPQSHTYLFLLPPNLIHNTWRPKSIPVLYTTQR